MFKVGMRVWDFKYGWGKVTEIRTSDKTFPVCVDFDDNEDWSESYTVDGKTNELWVRTLFFGEFEVPKEVLNPPKKPAREMLDECEGVEFIAGKDNFHIFLHYDKRGKSRVGWAESSFTDRLGIKYITKEDAQRIERECKENNREE